MTGVLVREENTMWTDRHRGEDDHVTVDAEIGVMQLQVKE